ncbi:hypothetical protein BJX65DRAFT_139692 [Aspergillus insuetus]
MILLVRFPPLLFPFFLLLNPLLDLIPDYYYYDYCCYYCSCLPIQPLSARFKVVTGTSPQRHFAPQPPAHCSLLDPCSSLLLLAVHCPIVLSSSRCFPHPTPLSTTARSLLSPSALFRTAARQSLPASHTGSRPRITR